MEAPSFVFSRSFAVAGLDITLPPVRPPFPLELSVQNLSPSLPGEAGLLEGELAHVHVVPASDQEDGRLTLVQLHLSPNPAS